MIYIEVKALAGSNFIRARDVIAVQQTSPDKCAVMMTGGITIPCSEPTRDIVARLETFLENAKESANGDGGGGNRAFDPGGPARRPCRDPRFSRGR